MPSKTNGIALAVLLLGAFLSAAEVAHGRAPAPAASAAAPVRDVAAPEAVRRLTLALEALTTLEARFTQTILDGRGMLLRESAGALWAARPERFRWEIDSPFAEVLVGDGTMLWLWDPDLEQVTVRPYDERLKGTPARLLSGSTAELVDGFDVALLREGPEREVFELRPREGDGLFDRLELVFANGVPQALVIHDSLGQRTELRLSDVVVGGPVDADRFAFSIPAGADVLREAPRGAADAGGA